MCFVAFFEMNADCVLIILFSLFLMILFDEKCDSGFIRYYELPPLADITMPEEEDWQHVNMVIKDTLIIHHARIIDVTTLRDLHVGLPKGSFGFLFRGQRVGYVPNGRANNDFLFTGGGMGDMDKNAFVDLGQDLVGQSCYATPVGGELNPPREYFCAVSTLEEAQSWVIALQWSVKVGQETLLRHTSSLTESETGNITLDCNIERINRGIEMIAKNRSESPKVSSDAGPKTGRILVTRVRDFRTIRAVTTFFFRWEIAYEVALLLIENKRNRIEERRILVTAQQLENMLKEMSKVVQSHSSFLNGLLRQLEDLPRFQSTRGKNNNAISAQAFESSITKVNTILRALAMEAVAVNSKSMRHLFGLDVDRPVIEQISSWRSYRAKSTTDAINKSTAPVIFRQVRSVSSVDDFVRQWLARKPMSLKSQGYVRRLCLEAKLWILLRPWFIVGMFGVLLASLYAMSDDYERNMIYVTARCDVLVLTTILAYWIGEKKGKASQQRKTRSTMSTTRKMAMAQRANKYENRSNKTLITPTSSIDAPADVIITTEALDDSVYDDGDDLDYLDQESEIVKCSNIGKLSSPLPKYPENNGSSCWSEPFDPAIFHVRGSTYLQDRVKVPSGRSPFKCRGVDLWLTDNPQRHIARHPSVLGGKIQEEDTFLVNFLLPFGNFVSYFSVPPLSEFPNKQVANVWSNFITGDQEYRDARLKLLPVVLDGPWIVKAAVGNGKSPALLGKVIPLQYFFRQPQGDKKGIYEVDVIISASSIAKGILNVVKGHAKSLSIAFAMIIEASTAEDLPETVLCSFQIHALDLEDCPHLPEHILDDIEEE